MDNSIREHSFKLLIKNYFKCLINSYNGINIIKTLLMSIIIGICAYLLTIYAFKNDNGAIIGILTTFIIINVISIVSNIINIKTKYFIELKNSFIFLIKGYFNNDRGLIEKIELLVLSIVGISLGVFVNHLLSLLVGITIYLSTLKNENSFILSIVYSIINLFNKKFYNHTKIELLSFGFSFFLILSSFIMLMIEVII